ncbi:MAG: CotH kinase family protein [Planctomycetota bacterium]|nr:CotH kinase family protein [Planctomycetota bacterium]
MPTIKSTSSTTLTSAMMMTIAAGLLLGTTTRPAPSQSESAVGDSGAPLSPDSLFPTDRVLDIRITMPTEDWDLIRRQGRDLGQLLNEKRREAPLEAPYKYVEADITIDGVEFRNVGVRKKGFFGSLSKSRPSLKVKLNFTDKSGGIGDVTHLTLNNNKQDRSLMSAFIGYAFFNAAGSPASRCSYAKVTVNGKDLGIYANVESIRRPFIKRVFGSDKGTLYEGTVTDFYDGWEGSFERKFGKKKAGRKTIEGLTKLLERRSRAPTQREIGRFVDLDAFYRFWAIEGLVNFWDGYSGNRNNYWFYIHPKTGRIHFLPWGADHLFQKDNPLGDDPGAPVSVRMLGRVAHKLYQLPEGRRRYAQAMQELLDEHWKEEKLLAEIDRVEAMLEPFIPRSHLGFQSAVERVRDWIEWRREDVVEDMEGGMPIWTKAPKPPPAFPGRLEEESDEYQALWAAARDGDLKAIRKQLDRGIDADISGARGTPLAIAALAGRYEAANLLIEEGANVNVINGDGSSLLHGPAFLGHTDIVELLIDNEIQLNVRDEDGWTPLDNASGPWSQQLTGIVEWLSDYTEREFDVREIKASRPKVAEMLRKSGAKRSSQLGKAPTGSLAEAAKAGDNEAVGDFLEAGTSPNKADKDGTSPLSWASMAGHEETVALLIDKGADVDQTNGDGSTSLHGAAFLGNTKVVELLLKSEADVNARNQKGETPLDTVAAPWGPGVQGVTQYIAGLLKLDVDLRAIQRARPKIARILRKNGGKPGSELK